MKLLVLMWSLEEINNSLTKTWKQTEEFMYFVVFNLLTTQLLVFEVPELSVYSN